VGGDRLATNCSIWISADLTYWVPVLHGGSRSCRLAGCRVPCAVVVLDGISVGRGSCVDGSGFVV
jgi:hypothetical protein